MDILLNSKISVLLMIILGLCFLMILRDGIFRGKLYVFFAWHFHRHEPIPYYLFFALSEGLLIYFILKLLKYSNTI